MQHGLKHKMMLFQTYNLNKVKISYVQITHTNLLDVEKFNIYYIYYFKNII